MVNAPFGTKITLMSGTVCEIIAGHQKKYRQTNGQCAYVYDTAQDMLVVM